MGSTELPFHHSRTTIPGRTMLRALILFTSCLLAHVSGDAWWCENRISGAPTECYYYQADCPQSCQKHATGPKGCEWGDKAGKEWCAQLVESYDGDCDIAASQYPDQCCETCGSAGVIKPTSKPTSKPPTATRKPVWGATKKPNSNHGGSQECGKTPIQPNLNGFIVGGVEARPNSLPWQVAVGEVGWGTGCGGSIINKNTVITAAHCIKQGAKYYFVAGQHKKYDYYGPYYKKYSAKVIVHPDYRSLTKNDIAIMKTDEDIEFNDGVQPICLPPADQEYGEERTMFLASGWGSLGNGYASHLMQVGLPYISVSTCQKMLGRWSIHEAVICAGYAAGGKDSCQGDSGGPLATVVDEKWTLAGVVSWGYGCAQRNKPGVYTHVAKYLDFINQHA